MSPIWGNRETAERGRRGEALAKRLLKQKGYRILAENFLCREGEIDLVAVHRGLLVFVEVKYHHSSQFGSALEAVTPGKLRRLRAAAAVFRQRHRVRRAYRFEVVAIEKTENGEQIEHLTSL